MECFLAYQMHGYDDHLRKVHIMNMKRYIEQLLEDIKDSKKVAKKRVVNITALRSGGELNEYNIIEDDNPTGIKLSDLFNIDQVFFPERCFLDNEQISVLTDAIESLWKAYGFNPIFHDKLPVSLRYSQFRNYLNQIVYPVPGEPVDVELCDYLPQHCPFAEECPVAIEDFEFFNKRNASA